MVDPATLPLAPRKMITLGAIGPLLGYTAGWAYRNVARLQREAEFPLPVDGTGRYDPAAIKAWQDLQIARRYGPKGPPRPPAAPETPAAANDSFAADQIAAMRAEMDARAEAMGGRHG